MFKFLEDLFRQPEEPQEQLDIPELIKHIRKKESESDIPLGRRIHSFHYKYFDFYVDREITKHYRVTVYQGRERKYSFTVFAKQGNYDILAQAFERIIDFIDGDQNLSDLPEDDVLKGFFYGH